MKHIFHAVALTFFGISHCFSLSIIESTHSDRLDKFITNKNDENIIKNTTTIYSVLSDEERVDRSRPATDIERKTIFQSIMATRIIDGGISVNGQAIASKTQDGTAFAAPTGPSTAVYWQVVHQFIMLFTSGTVSANNPRIIGSMATIK